VDWCQTGLSLVFLLLSTTILRGQIPSEFWPPKAPVIPHSVKLTSGIPYGPHPQNVLDILEPKKPSVTRRPGVILIHGGGWIGGSRDWVAEHVALRYVEKGFVCANLEYRTAPVALAPAAVEDVLRAARWFIKHSSQFRVDPQRIVVTGDSAGGHLALMVGMTPAAAGFGAVPPPLRAVVNFFGIADVTDQLAGPHRRFYTEQWIPEQPGREELARRVSPLSYVRKGVPMILTLHGTEDPSVPYAHAARLTESLDSIGARAVLITVSGGSHGFPKAQTDEIYEKYVWPFLGRLGIMETRANRTEGGDKEGRTLSCVPQEQCRSFFRGDPQPVR
jgi:acetyl esterase/lipase